MRITPEQLKQMRALWISAKGNFQGMPKLMHKVEIETVLLERQHKVKIRDDESLKGSFPKVTDLDAYKEVLSLRKVHLKDK